MNMQEVDATGAGSFVVHVVLPGADSNEVEAAVSWWRQQMAAAEADDGLRSIRVLTPAHRGHNVLVVEVWDDELSYQRAHHRQPVSSRERFFQRLGVPETGVEATFWHDSGAELDRRPAQRSPSRWESWCFSQRATHRQEPGGARYETRSLD